MKKSLNSSQKLSVDSSTFCEYGPEYKDQMLQRWMEFSKDMTDEEKTVIIGQLLSFLSYGFNNTESYWWSREAAWYLKLHDKEISINILSEWNYNKDNISDQMRELFEIIGHPNLLVGGIHSS